MLAFLGNSTKTKKVGETYNLKNVPYVATVVFIAGCEDGFIPMKKYGDEEPDIDEERRLFYVVPDRKPPILKFVPSGCLDFFFKREAYRKSYTIFSAR